MKKISRAQFLSSTPPLLALAAASGRLLAQGGDTPIIISDGSLKMHSGVRWADYPQETPTRRRHPNNGKHISSVEVLLAGNTTAVPFSNQQCEVTVTYAGMDVVLTTNPTGRNLKIETNWSAFQAGATPNDLEHTNPTSSISRVIVKRDGTAVVDQSPSGGTRITVHYVD